jgi:hypothetical protein
VNIGGNHIPAFQAHDAFQVVAIAARHQECTLEAAQYYDIPHAIYRQLVTQRPAQKIVPVVLAQKAH